MQTADHKDIDSRLIETRRLTTLETSPFCQPQTSHPAPLHNKTPHYLLWGSHSLEGISLLWTPVWYSSKNYSFSTSPKTVSMFLFGTNKQRPNFSNSTNYCGCRDIMKAFEWSKNCLSNIFHNCLSMWVPKRNFLKSFQFDFHI